MTRASNGENVKFPQSSSVLFQTQRVHDDPVCMEQVECISDIMQQWMPVYQTVMTCSIATQITKIIDAKRGFEAVLSFATMRRENNTGIVDQDIQVFFICQHM